MSRPWSSVPSQNVPPVGDFGRPAAACCPSRRAARDRRDSAARSAARRSPPRRRARAAPGRRPRPGWRGSRSRCAGTGFARRGPAPCGATGSTDSSVGSGHHRVIPWSPSAARAGRARNTGRRPARLITMNSVDDDEQVADDHRPVEQVDRVDQELAHARPREHALGHDRERDQRCRTRRPITVTIGIRMLRSTCTPMTRPLVRPFARANFT